MRRFRFERDQHSYLLAHALQRSLLSQLCGVAPRELRFEAGTHGRPELVWPERAPRLRFNISHTHGLVACALSFEHDVGVDVEHVERRLDIDQLAPSVFSQRERDAMAQLNDAGRRQRFFELWTLKESYIKAVGLGLALPLRSITFYDLEQPAPRVALAAPITDDPSRWSLHVRRLGREHMLASAYGAEVSRVTVEEIDPTRA